MNERWVRGDGSGVEERLASGIGEALGARLVWERGTVTDNIDRLARGELDLVIGGLTNAGPWSGRAALTRPYVKTRTKEGKEVGHVLALPKGENAFLLRVELLLRRAPAGGVSEWREGNGR